MAARTPHCGSSTTVSIATCGRCVSALAPQGGCYAEADAMGAGAQDTRQVGCRGGPLVNTQGSHPRGCGAVDVPAPRSLRGRRGCAGGFRAGEAGGFARPTAAWPHPWPPRRAAARIRSCVPRWQRYSAPALWLIVFPPKAAPTPGIAVPVRFVARQSHSSVARRSNSTQ